VAIAAAIVSLRGAPRQTVVGVVAVDRDVDRGVRVDRDAAAPAREPVDARLVRFEDA
jgi:hypothetical protein